MITGTPLELMVAAVIGLDAVIVAGYLIHRAVARNAAGNGRQADGAAQVPPERYATIVRAVPPKAAPPMTPLATVAPAQEIGQQRNGPQSTTPAVETVIGPTRAQPSYAPRPGTSPPPALEGAMPVADDVGPRGAESTRGEWQAPIEPEAIPTRSLEAEPAGVAPAESPGPELAPPEAYAPREANSAVLAAYPLPVEPAPNDASGAWVDPLAMATAAANEWRRALRRELALAAHRGRSGTILHIELDQVSAPTLSGLEGALLDLIGGFVRGTDYVDRTGLGRFHVILSEIHESGAAALAERIRARFHEAAPSAPAILIGWAAMTSETDAAAALERAAEQVEAERARIRGTERAPETTGAETTETTSAEPTAGSAGAPAAGSDVASALATLERLRSTGLINAEEYRSKRAEILARL